MFKDDFVPVLGCADVRRLDALTIGSGVASLDLMEHAGERIVEALSRSQLAEQASRQLRVAVVTGKGNNGGDGCVVARLLAARGWHVVVVLAVGEPEPGTDCGINLARWRMEGGRVATGKQGSETLDAGSYDLVIDALLGTGLTRTVEGELAAWIERINGCGLPVLAIDVPSGLCADRGVPLGVAVRARATVTLGAAKPGLFVGQGPDYCGRVEVADIDLLDPREHGIEGIGQALDGSTCATWMPERRPTTHKGDLGHVAVVGGSQGKTGAPLLAVCGALRAGAGLVTVALPAGLLGRTPAAPLEMMTMEIADDGDGRAAPGCWRTLAEQMRAFTCAVIGPGMGTGPGTSEVVQGAIAEFAGTLVIDADALNVLARERSSLAGMLSERRRRGHGPVVLTPHPGEMGRLVGSDAAAVQAERLAAARAFVAVHEATLVLKGAATIVADGPRIAFNLSGNPGMASAGMGDTLAGILGAMVARIDDPFRAACAGVYLHGLAADILGQAVGAPGFLASEVADSVPEAIASLPHKARRELEQSRPRPNDSD